MMKLISTMSVIGIFVFAAWAITDGQMPVIGPQLFEANGVRMLVPVRYIDNGKGFFWIEETEGLDSDEGSFSFKIPIDDIEMEVPEIKSLVGNNVHKLTGIIYVGSIKDIKKSNKLVMSRIENMIRREGEYTDLVFEKDHSNGFYRAYQVAKGNKKIKYRWDIFTDSPDNLIANGLSEYDHIASCVEKSKITFDHTCLTSFSVNNNLVSLYFGGKLLPYHHEIKNYITDLIQEWEQAAQSSH